jgi:hypothetical protein
MTASIGGNSRTMNAVAAPALPRRRPAPAARGTRTSRGRAARYRAWARTAGWYIAKWCRQMLNVVTHPEDAFWDLKRTGDWWSVPFMLVCAIAARGLLMGFMGFHYIFQGSADVKKTNFDGIMENVARTLTLSMTSFFYSGNPEDTSIIQEAIRIVVPFATWCLAHYAIAMIFYGEGSLKHVCLGAAFSLTPFILFSWPAAMFLTNVTTLSEKGMYWGLSWAIRLWIVYLFFVHIRVMHDFTFRRTLSTYALSLTSVVIIWGLVALVYALSLNTYEFFYGIFYEFTTR